MGIRQLHGFLLDKQQLSARWGEQSVKETLLIEMDSVLDDVFTVRDSLPAYGNTTGVSFTIGLSFHPGQPALVFKECTNVVVHPEGRPFWLADLTYETPAWLDLNVMTGPGSTPGGTGKGNTGRKKRLRDGDPIRTPWDEPPSWSGGSKSVKLPTHKDSAGRVLQHGNFLPIQEGINIDINLETHSFSWNVEYAAFDAAGGWAGLFRPHVGTLNSGVVFNKDPMRVLLESVQCIENYKTTTIPTNNPLDNDGSVPIVHHFVSITANFVVDPRPIFAGGDDGYFRESNKRVSMHTLCVWEPGVYGGIPINQRGDYATSPWPFPSAAARAAQGLIIGDAYPFTTVHLANPSTDFYIIDPEYPTLSNLTGFVNRHNLVIP